MTKSHADIIALWPTAAAFARDVSTPTATMSPANARQIRKRGIIPPKFWHGVAAAAANCGFEGISYARLAEMARKSS